MSNIAVQRGRKAARRKQVLAGRRKAEGGRSPSIEKIERAAASPFYACMMPERFDSGIGTVVVARGYGSLLTVAMFLADTSALGVKDAFLRSMEASQFDETLDHMDTITPMRKADPAEVRKFLGDLVAWSRDIGFEPAAYYRLLERIFGDVDAADSDAIFTFGNDGAPFYISGPNDTPGQIRQRMAILAKYNERKGLPPPTVGEFEI